MCCRLMEIHFPNRSAVICTLIIIGIALIQVLNVFHNSVYLLFISRQDRLATVIHDSYYYNENTVDSVSESNKNRHYMDFNANQRHLLKSKLLPVTCIPTNDTGFCRVKNTPHRNLDAMFHSLQHVEADVTTTLETGLSMTNWMIYPTKYHGVHTDGHQLYAVCEFVVDSFAFHLPHTMQQLYRCWSWWWSHKKIQHNTRPVLIFPRANVPRNAFVQGFISNLQDTIGLQLVNSKNLDLIGLQVDHNGTYTTDQADTLFSIVKPRFPPNLLDPRNTFGMKDPTSAYFDMLAVEDARALRDIFFANVMTSDSVNTINGIDKDSKKKQVQSILRLANQEKEKNIGPRIAILNRHNKRELQNASIIATNLQDFMKEVYSNATVSIVYFDNKTTFVDQIQFFSTTDIVISPHGAQLTGIPFMPNCGGVFELFPKGYYHPYYFGSLSAAVGVHHAFTSSTKNSAEGSPGDDELWREESRQGMHDQKTRQSVRNQPLCMEPSTIVLAVRKLLEDRESCLAMQTYYGGF